MVEKKEISELEYLMGSDKSEFLAVYGRRRVGKSFLVGVYRTVGVFIKNEEMTEESYRQEQLKHFYNSLLQYGLPQTASHPTTWLQAFTLLTQLLKRKRAKRKVIFLDELPWVVFRITWIC